MKFVSKSGNYRIILDRGLPAEPMTGRSAVAGVSVKFEDGMVNVDDPKIIERLLAHESFGRDFVKVEEHEIDPYKHQRQEIEPEHDIQELKYGAVQKNVNPKPKVTVTPETKKALTEMAIEMAKEMAPAMAMEILKKAKIESEKEPVAKAKAKPVKRGPKPKKTQKVDKVEKAPEATEEEKPAETTEG